MITILFHRENYIIVGWFLAENMENVELDLSENGGGNTDFDAGTEENYDMVVGGESTEQTRTSILPHLNAYTILKY